MRLLLLCALGLSVACWELSTAETTLGTSARQLTIDARLYHERQTFQIAGTIAVAAVAAAIFLWIFERSHLAGSERLMWIAFDLFAATSLIGLLSLNSVDRLANMLVLGFPVVQWLKLASATLALLGSAQPLLVAPAIPNGR